MTTDDRTVLARRALALRLIADRVKAADSENRAAIADTFPVKDRAVVWLPDEYGRDVEAGHARVDRGAVTASVSDMAALVEWVAANRPDEVEVYQPEPVKQIRRAYLTRLLADAKAAGTAVSPDGEAIPGISVTEGDPKVVVVPAKTDDGQLALIDALRKDPAALQSLLQLPAGGGA